MKRKDQSKMKAGVLIGIVLLLISALLVGACAKAPAPATPAPGTPAPPVTVTVTATPAAVKPIVLKYGCWLTVTHARWLGDGLRFAEELQARSGGRIKLEIFPGGQLGGGHKEQYAAVRDGLLDIGHSTATYGAPYEDIASYYMPLVPMPDIMIGGIAGMVLFDRYLGPKAAKPLPVFKEVMGWAGSAFNPGAFAFVKKEVKTLEDWKGLKVAVQSTSDNEIVTALGGVPVTIAADEMYQTLVTGVAGAAVRGPTTWHTFGINDVAKYWIPNFRMPLGSVMYAEIVNLKTWNSLPPDLQQIIAGLAKRVNWWCQQTYHELELEADARITKAGLKKIDIPADELAKWNKVVESVSVAPNVAKLDKAGYPGREMYDLFTAMVTEYRKIGPFSIWNYEQKAEEMYAKYMKWTK